MNVRVKAHFRRESPESEWVMTRNLLYFSKLTNMDSTMWVTVRSSHQVWTRGRFFQTEIQALQVCLWVKSYLQYHRDPVCLLKVGLCLWAADSSRLVQTPEPNLTDRFQSERPVDGGQQWSEEERKPMQGFYSPASQYFVKTVKQHDSRGWNLFQLVSTAFSSFLSWLPYVNIWSCRTILSKCFYSFSKNCWA